jgi:hypothetical protein
MGLSSVVRGSARFQILAPVGQGGAGHVYEAFDRERNARVALKTLRQPDAEGILQLKNEFRAIQDLRHPNIVTPKELFEHDGQWFFTMDLVRGVDFVSYVRPGGSSPGLPDDARLRAALGELALGLSALHADHKVHRDIKPANVLVAEDGRVQILDFGIVSDLTEKPRAEDEDALLGTVPYMAPEQAMGVAVTPAADWYAVGVMLYQALTGSLPFAGSMAEVLAQKAVAEPPAPAKIQPRAPTDLNELCVALLHPEPERRLEGFDVLSRLGLTATPGSVTRARAAQFVGRRAQLDAIEAAFESVRTTGAAVTVLVSGESGVGKSRLVREFTQSAASETDVLVFRGRCYERESLSYKALDGVIDEVARYLATLPAGEVAGLLPEGVAALRHVFPALETIPAIAEARITGFDAQDPQAARARMFALVRQLFVQIARHRPVVLAIDDLQWADPDSLLLLSEILRTPESPALLLLASIRSATERFRSTSVHDRFAQLPGDVRWLRLDPLPESEARDLVRSLLERADGADDAANVDAILAEAKGHPLFIDELVRHRAGHVGAPAARLDEALWERATRLAPSALRLLEIVAVAGVPTPQHVMATAAALDPGQFFDAVGALRSARYVRTSGVYRHDTVEAYHDRVRESVLAHIDGPARKAWHGRLALALEQERDTEPEKLVTHWVGAGENRRAAEAAVKAAEGASASLAFDHAASLYRLAIDLGDRTGDELVALKVKLAEALINAARGADAGRVYLDAAGDGTSNRALDLRRRAAEQFVCSGCMEEGTRTFESVLKAVGVRVPQSRLGVLVSILFTSLWLALRRFRYTPRRAEDVDPRVLLRLDCMQAATALGMTDHVRGREFQNRALVDALKVGEPVRLGHALAIYGCASPSAGASAFPATMKVQKLVESMALELKSPYLEAMSYSVTAFAYYLSGQFAKSREPFERAEIIFRDRCIGVAFVLATARMMLYRVLIYVGDLPSASRLVDVTLRDAEQKGDLYTVVNLRTNCTAIVAMARDDVAAAQRELDAIVPHLPKRGFHVQHALYCVAQSWLWLYAGEPARAREKLAAVWKAIKGSMLLRIQTTRIALHDLRARAAIALLASRSGDAVALRNEAEHFVRLLEGERLPWATAHAEALRGCLAYLDGARDQAAARLKEAEDGFGMLKLALLGAAARRARGIVLGGEDGRALVADAEAALKRTGVENSGRMMASLLPGIETSAARAAGAE